MKCQIAIEHAGAQGIVEFDDEVGVAVRRGVLHEREPNSSSRLTSLSRQMSAMSGSLSANDDHESLRGLVHSKSSTHCRWSIPDTLLQLLEGRFDRFQLGGEFGALVALLLDDVGRGLVDEGGVGELGVDRLDELGEVLALLFRAACVRRRRR